MDEIGGGRKLGSFNAKAEANLLVGTAKLEAGTFFMRQICDSNTFAIKDL